MENCLMDEMQTARERGEDLTTYLARIKQCCWDHEVASCEICRSDGLLPAQDCIVRVYNLGVRT
jgi:hypothetical protein